MTYLGKFLLELRTCNIRVHVLVKCFLYGQINFVLLVHGVQGYQYLLPMNLHPHKPESIG